MARGWGRTVAECDANGTYHTAARTEYRLRMNQNESDSHANQELAKFAYQILMQRSLSEHAEMWQTPSLALAAQSLLLTVAIDQDSKRWIAVLVSVLAVIVAAMSMQLMAVRRFNNNLDRRKMTELEQELGMIEVSERGWAFRDGKYASTTPRISIWRTAPTYQVWQAGLLTFLIADVAVLVYAALR